MSTKVRLIFVAGSTLDLDPAQDPYLGCTFWPEFKLNSGSGSSPIYVSPEVIVVGGSTPDLDPALDPYLACTLWPEFMIHLCYGPIYVPP